MAFTNPLMLFVFVSISFRALCTGERANDNGERLCYVGTKFDRVIAPEYIIQGGLINNSNTEDEPSDSIGQSVFGQPFELENTVEINEEGLVCFAHSSSNNLNGSQFFVTLKDDLKIHEFFPSTVVGRVVRGLEILKSLDNVKVDEDDRPLPGEEVTIVRCGELELKRRNG